MKKWHLWLAASIGLVVIAAMMIREFDLDALSKIHLSPQFFAGTGIAVLLFAVQNLMYTLRFRYLCQRKLLGWVLKACCKIPGLRRFQPKIERFSNDMTLASQEAKFEGSRFWLRLMGYTSVAWLARFAIVAAILFAFQCQGDMLIAWCRQWVMWMISILSPTPGGSGVAELMFRLYYADYLPDASVAILAAMLWRAIFYYPFLIMGTIVLPKWIGRKL